MDLHFIGCGSAFYTEGRNTSAYFIEDDCLFIIDCGESVFASLKQKNIFLNIKKVYVVVSHTHSDHSGSLGTLGFYCQFILHTKLNIIVPHDKSYVFDLKKLMSLFGNTSESYRFIYEEELDNVFRSFSCLRYDMTKHDYVLSCFSFVFETSKGAVFYSADTRTTENVVRFIKSHSDIDCIYMEATDLKITGDLHLYIGELKKAVPVALFSKVRLMHLRSKDCIDRLLDEGFKIVDCE